MHVVGLPAGSRWGSGLPGCGKRGEDRERRGGGVGGGNEREMKIAWRYGERFSGGGGAFAVAFLFVGRLRGPELDALNRKDVCSEARACVCLEPTTGLMRVFFRCRPFRAEQKRLP